MRYEKVKEAVFLSRPNRFIAKVLLEGQEETVHVKNTGRCKELLIPGTRVWLSESDKAERKTRYDLIAVEKAGQLLINMDSQLPNAAAAEWLPQSGLFSPEAKLRREVTWGASRFDLYVEDGDRKAFLEVKGVTLERDGLALFPDAPTQRGVKHLKELAACIREGYEAYVLFVIQMKEVTAFSPNEATDPAFAAALRQAEEDGVKILAYDCAVTPDSMELRTPVPYALSPKNCDGTN